MKKIILLILTLSILALCSCKNNTESTEKNVTKANEEIADTVTDSNLEKDPTTAPNDVNDEDTAIKKPSTVEEIIAFANELNIDTSMTKFSLENVLPEAQLADTPDAGDEYQNSTAYLGDSVTMGLAFFGNHPEEMVIAKGSINPLDAVEKQLIELEDGTMVNFPTALSKTGAKRAVLTFGSNAISIMSEEVFLKYYIKLIDEIQNTCPDCDIIIQSITPLATTCTLKKLTNTLVNRSNLLLLVLAYSKELKFLDSTAEMKDNDGYLRIEYCSSDDGIHINELGYSVWINMLRHHSLEN